MACASCTVHTLQTRSHEDVNFSVKCTQITETTQFSHDDNGEAKEEEKIDFKL